MKRDWLKRGNSKSSQGVAFTAAEEANPRQWFLDSGASQHMIGDKSLLKPWSRLRMESGRSSLATRGAPGDGSWHGGATVSNTSW
jgi:hypothetical protein